MDVIFHEPKGNTRKIKEEDQRIRETRKRMETISHQLLEVCEKEGLTIIEMIELSRIFPHLIKEEIRMIEQKTSFTTNHNQD